MTGQLSVSNQEFLQAIFGENYIWAHVTDFTFDPNDIPKDQHMIAWSGDYFSRYQMRQNTNQYFTISTFYCDENNRARRRKALFKDTPCIVLDDVKEKLSMTEVQKLPRPAWILETSTGSEQWGYILDTPCAVRSQVENLLDGLVANGLAPDGKDPGMKGVTRYVRLPEGINNKASKLVNGQPFSCRMLQWEPFNRVTMEQLAAPFHVDLNAVRREQRVDGAAAISDHPLINIPDIIHIKEVRSDGRFDIRCPWVDEHTGADDSGSAVFTNDDGSIGFKCHHGACQNRTGTDLLRYIDTKQPGWSSNVLKMWQFGRSMDMALPVAPVVPAPPQPTVSFMDPVPAVVTQPAALTLDDMIKQQLGNLRREEPGSREQRDAVAQVLKLVDDLPKIDQKHWHEEVRDITRWSKPDFNEILKDLRNVWYGEKVSGAEFYDDLLFVREINQFYDVRRRMFLTAEAMQNGFADQDAEARKIALQEGRVQKVDKLDYAPKQPRIFTEGPITYGNTWCDGNQSAGRQGNIDRWYQHFDTLGWGEYREHVMKWMAFTLRYPERKINHMLILGGLEGSGKDFILYPLIKGMGDNAQVISGEELLEGFNDYVLSTKYLHINETELGDRKEALAVSNKLKPIAAAPPERLSVNRKNIARIQVRNIINGTMTTNSQLPLRLNGQSRRFLALWSDLNPRDHMGNMTAEWQRYWDDRWTWMRDNGGWEHVIHHLMTAVDLSDFDPGVAPPVTDFLRDIQDASKSPMQQTLEAFIFGRTGLFRSDLLTAKDMVETIKAQAVFNDADIFCDVKMFNPVNVGRVLGQIQGVMQLRAKSETGAARVYAIRNPVRYQVLGPADLYREYDRQVREIRGQQPLTIVK